MSSRLNSAAWNFYEHINDPEQLQAAIKWVKKSIRLDKSHANLDTHAALLFKLGQTSKALKTAQKAIALAKEAGEDYSSTEELIKKFTKLKVKLNKKCV